VDPQVLRVYLYIHFFRFGKHRHCDRRGMYAARCLRLWNSLDAMYARFVFELRVNAVTFYQLYGLFGAADSGLRCIESLDAPALPLGGAGIQSHDLRGKQSSFIAAGARSNFG